MTKEQEKLAEVIIEFHKKRNGLPILVSYLTN